MSKVSIINGSIIVSYLNDRYDPYDWAIYEPIVVCLSNGSALVIERGFVTDFASVPKIFWSAIAPVGHYNLAAVIHDYIYTNHNYSREFADKEFLIWLNTLAPENKFRNKIMYWCVRIFGAIRYKKYGRK